MSSIPDIVREAGIVGAGGAGFPTHVKLSSQVDTVIANGAECEPLLRCDKAVMRHRTEDVLQGLHQLGSVGLTEAPPEHATAVFLCCLCGAGEVYACPLGLSPRKVFDNLRANLVDAGLKNPHHRDSCSVNEFQHRRRIPLPRSPAG